MANQIVKIDNMKFVPAELNIKVGDTVAWSNQDEMGHSACRQAPPAFDTGLIESGETSDTVPFHQQGSFDYFCRQHPHMTGKVVVA
jgi:plastocyanin